MGLFYKALLTKTLTYKRETCTGRKQSKEHITVLAGANMNRNKKFRLVVGSNTHVASEAYQSCPSHIMQMGEHG